MTTTHTSAAPPTPETAGDGRHEHRRLLVGDLVVRRVDYRSVSRVAWPLLSGLLGGTLLVGVLAWNVAALAGWSPADQDLVGTEVFWSAVAAAVVLVPLGVGLALATAGLYNAISERAGGIEVKVVSPRRRRRRTVYD